MNKYELALVVSAKLDEEARNAVLDRAKNYITRFGGQIVEVEEWGKRKLAYEIDKNTDGYYYFVNFEAEGTTPNDLEKRMRIMDNVLRYLVVRKDENDTFKVVPEKAPIQEAPEEVEAPVEEEAPAVEEAPVEEAPAEEEAE